MLKTGTRKSETQKRDDYYSAEETEQRTRAIVRASARTLPVPLKAIPKKTGGKRKLKGAKNMPAIGGPRT